MTEDASPELRKARHVMFLFTGGFLIGGGFTERTLRTKIPADLRQPFQSPAWDVYARPWAYRYIDGEDIFVENADKHNWIEAEIVEQVRAFYLREACEKFEAKNFCMARGIR